jgi:hypothetical protein
LQHPAAPNLFFLFVDYQLCNFLAIMRRTKQEYKEINLLKMSINGPDLQVGVNIG